MTSARRRGKSFAGALLAEAAAWLGLAVLVVAGVGGMMAGATTTESVVTDPRTGLAIAGFDPVGYFIDRAASPGRAEFEFRHRGVTWRFRNSGNRAAFMDSPGDYEPRFGGYDPVAIGRGAPTPGNPEVWLVWEQRLYLFFAPRSREEFTADPQRIVMQADARWPDVRDHVLSR
jgi:hypothetical protein